MKRITLLFVLMCGIIVANAQVKNILFLGNSYTNVNELPALVKELAASANHSAVVDWHTPGGWKLGLAPDAHRYSLVSLGKINSTNWDYVVLQEQSQIPTIPFFRDSTMYPAAREIRDAILANDTCTQVLFYMTWGRRFGGQQCAGGQCSPAFTDFSHMQDSLETAYMRIANELNEPVSPVGIAWKQVIEDTNIVLHTGDNSHPNAAGSYLAACVFYASIWHESPEGLSFHFTLDSALATYMQQVAANVVLTNPAQWNIDTTSVDAQFSTTVQSDSVSFTNTSYNATDFLWDFGDGDTSSSFEPMHIYAAPGTYNVILEIFSGCLDDTVHQTVVIEDNDTINDTIIGIAALNAQASWNVYPNPSNGIVSVTTEIDLETTMLLVTNLFGQVVYQENTVVKANQAISLDLSALPTGTYWIQLQSETQLLQRALLLQ